MEANLETLSDKRNALEDTYWGLDIRKFVSDLKRMIKNDTKPDGFLCHIYSKSWIESIDKLSGKDLIESSPEDKYIDSKRAEDGTSMKLKTSNRMSLAEKQKILFAQLDAIDECIATLNKEKASIIEDFEKFKKGEKHGN